MLVQLPHQIICDNFLSSMMQRFNYQSIKICGRPLVKFLPAFEKCMAAGLQIICTDLQNIRAGMHISDITAMAIDYKSHFTL